MSLKDVSGNKRFPLSSTEAKVLSLVGPGSTLNTLANAVKASGLKLRRDQIDVLIARLAADEFMQIPRGVVTLATPVMALDDIVPAFRADLVVTESSRMGLVQVMDTRNDVTFTLYDFEVNVARLLDGRHTVAEVIERAAEIGISVSSSSLAQFVSQMRAYGFVTSDASKGSTDDSTWPARAHWSPETRELFQSALRQLRWGKPQLALEYIDAMLELQPGTTEAIELKARIDAKLQSGKVLEMNFEDLHKPSPPPPPEVELTPTPRPTMREFPTAERPSLPGFTATTDEIPQAQVAAFVDAVGMGARTVEVPATNAPPVAAPAMGMPTVELPVSAAPVFDTSSSSQPFTTADVEPVKSLGDVEPSGVYDSAEAFPSSGGEQLKRRRTMMVAAASAVALLFPMRTTSKIEVDVQNQVLGELKVPRLGSLQEMKVVDGAVVKKGAVIAILDSAKEREESETLKKRADTREAESTSVAQRHRPEQLARTQRLLDKAQAALKKATLPNPPKGGSARKAYEKKLAKLNQTVARLEVAVAHVNYLQKAKELKASAAADRTRVEQLNQIIENSSVLAPADGVFRSDGRLLPGAIYSDRDTVGRIIAPKARVEGVPPDALSPVLVVGDQRLPLSKPETAGGPWTVALENGVSLGPAEVEVKGGFRPWPLALLSR